MEKPNPIHNWRSFLKEYAIIVIGVLTALVAQQAAEWWHWRSEVATARQALKAEMGVNNGFFARRISNAPCLERQVSEADAILAALEAHHEPSKFTNFRNGNGNLLLESEWQSERASQVLTHFPRAELAVMGSYYAMLPDYKNWISQEGESWRELSGLRKPLPGLTASDLAHLRVSLETAKISLGLIISNAPRMLRWSKQLGIVDPIVDPIMLRNFCTMDDPHWQHYVRTRLR
jgi:hypothetical protein